MSAESRKIEKSLPGRETQDGAGVRLTRIISQPLQYRLDPFLMLDFFEAMIQMTMSAAFRNILTGDLRP